jgi:DNA-binding NtrC family response regulator
VSDALPVTTEESPMLRTAGDDSILLVGASQATDDAAAALSADWNLTTVRGLEEAATELGFRPHRVVLVDSDAVEEPPWRVVEILRETEHHTTVLLMVAPDTPWTTFSSYRQRPAGLLLKPLDRTAVLMAVDSALVYGRLLDENRNLKRQLGTAMSLRDWVGCTPASLEVRKRIATAALANGSVALIAEDGSGRRLAAELIHRHGRNPGATFLPIDLTSLPPGELPRLLREVRDAAAGGGQDYAHGARPGTLYLAELTGLGREDQRALAELLRERLPFRLMVSADPSIEESVRLGQFDAEAWGAVSKITIPIPALRKRRGDIPLLIDHFLKRFCRRFELEPLGIPPSAIENYSNYDWPGSVAELSMMIERAVSIASAAKFQGTTLPEAYCAPPSLTVPEPIRLKNVSLRELIADIEKRIILQTLERVDGCQRRAAEELRLNPTTLHEKMKRYKILPERHPRA